MKQDCDASFGPFRRENPLRNMLIEKLCHSRDRK